MTIILQLFDNFSAIYPQSWQVQKESNLHTTIFLELVFLQSSILLGIQYRNSWMTRKVLWHVTLCVWVSRCLQPSTSTWNIAKAGSSRFGGYGVIVCWPPWWPPWNGRGSYDLFPVSLSVVQPPYLGVLLLSLSHPFTVLLVLLALLVFQPCTRRQQQPQCTMNNDNWCSSHDTPWWNFLLLLDDI